MSDLENPQQPRLAKEPGSPQPIPGRCGSPLRKRPGRFCEQRPLKGKTRCRIHGGPSLAGPAHPNWKTGMYSDVLPRNLAGHYAAARQNPALTALGEQIAVIDAKVFELFEQLAHGESPAAWANVKQLHGEMLEALDAFAAARKAADAVGLALAMKNLSDAVARLGVLAEHGADGARAWNFITSQIYLRKKLVDSEVKRQKIAHETLDRKRALSMLSFIADSIARHVKDPQAKQAVVNDIRVLMGNTLPETG